MHLLSVACLAMAGSVVAQNCIPGLFFGEDACLADCEGECSRSPNSPDGDWMCGCMDPDHPDPSCSDYFQTEQACKDACPDDCYSIVAYYECTCP